jgi:peptide/nickel transport system substrate-binding protein
LASIAERAFSRRSLTKLLAASVAGPAVASLLAACGGSSKATATKGSASGSPTSGGIAATSVAGASTPLNTFQNPPTATGATGSPSASSPTSAASAPTSAATEASGPVKQGGTLHLSEINDPDTLDPVLSSSIVSSNMYQHIYDCLVFIGEDHTPHPWLAQKWTIENNGLQITMTLQSDVKFHDGTPLDSTAVKAQFDRTLDPKTASISKTGLGPLTTIDALDPQTVRFTFSAPFAPFFTNLDGFGIVSPTALQKFGDSYGHNPVGSGPFMFKEWQQGQSVTLVKNPNYVQHRDEYKNPGPPYLDQLQWKIIGESATRNAALLSGELDLAGVDLTQASTVQNNPEFQVYIWKERDGFIFIEYNLSKFPFNDLAVRKAMAYSMDRDEMVRSAYNGYATALLLPIPTGVAGYDESLNQYAYPFSVDNAKKALTDGGYAPGSDGIMAKDGQKLSFTMLVYSGNDPLKLDAEIIQSTLKEVGMDCKIQVLDFSAELPMLNAGNFDCDIMRWTSPDPNILTLMFHSPGWTQQTHDPALDKLLETADQTLDPTKRLDAVHAAVKYLLDQAIVAPIVTDWSLWAVHQYVKGYSIDVFGNSRLADVWLDK